MKKIYLLIMGTFVVSNSVITVADTNLPNVGNITQGLNDLKPKYQNETSQQSFLDQNLDQKQVYSQDQTLILINRVNFVGNTIFDQEQLIKQIEGTENKEQTLSDLQKATEKITQYYRQHGYFLARAYLPKQELNHGNLVIHIMEGNLGKIELDNQSKVKNQVIKKFLDHIPLNQALNENVVNHHLLILSDVSGIGNIQADLSAGEQLGQTQLNLHLPQIERGYRGSIGLDNQGSSYTGQYRLNSYIELLSPLGYGEKINAQAVVSNQDFIFGNIGTQVPVHFYGLIFGGNIARTNYELGKQFSTLNAHGVSSDYHLNLIYPYIRQPNTNVHLEAAFDYRKLIDEIGATEVKTKKVSQVARFNISAEHRDDWGRGRLKGGTTNVNLEISYGRLDIQSPDAFSIDQQSAKTDGSFQKYELSLDRQQQITNNFSVSALIYGQLASKNLDSSEKFSFKQMRAYPSAEAMGDQGLAGSLGLFYQVVPMLNLYLFQDVGKSFYNKNAYINEKNQVSLASTGIGVVGRNKGLDYNFSISWRNNVKALTDEDHNPRLIFQVRKSF